MTTLDPARAARPETFTSHNGAKAPLPFSPAEYARRLAALRALMAERDIPAVLLTSMHNIAYYSGFLYCSFGRSYACVVTQTACTTVSANIDAGQPWRRSQGENVIYTDWRRDNFWRAVEGLVGRPGRIGVEGDHLTLAQRGKLAEFLGDPEIPDIAPAVMALRMLKSPEEIALITEGARIADLGGAAIRDAIRPATREIDVAMAGRNAMELEIARAHPQSELRDTWVWFQSGLNTDGAHNPVTTRALAPGDILSLNCFPMISGYYTALERTLFLGEPDAASLRIWQANVATHELGLSLIRPGISCAQICDELNRFLAQEGLLQYRSFGYGHSFGILSHYYGREAGLELREDIDTVLEPGMVVSMEPMLWIPEGLPGAGGYREHDILVVTPEGARNITGFPFGPQANIL
ncbi:aminopeptidase P family protein [Pseudooceanicola sp. CBS1P-1]|uniref:M24 family metallopeptidase n=1 Tax=Pseudooceanicola albus TaxID=2692189 RepID=A0A6L7G7J2_9RHOB|nr:MULTISPECIES: M24 family metallopeptidase [Pseudooceanicola]MBT9383092.1 aminopeptidase P family protein [Pseudooceanicola endophyticus]MXN19280.1 M24 family metallopeptidase [Pseudooceanicola albus]